jgi:uncharacterized protein YkwD
MSSNQFDQRIVELVNEERAVVGLDPLAIDSQLDQAANLHNDEMVQADIMSHKLSGEAGLGDRISATGYEWSGAAENIAAGYATPEEVVEGWLNSPGHRANILNSEYTDIGIGYENAPDENAGEYDSYWTQVFGKSDNPTPESNDDFKVEMENVEINNVEPIPQSNEPIPQNNEPIPQSNEPIPPSNEVNNVDTSPEPSELKVEDGGNYGNYDQRIVELVNQERAAAGLDPLTIDSQLDQAANLHTDEMVQADSMSHQLPGEARLGDRVSATGYQWSGLAENIAGGYATPEEVVEGWLNSPGHRANILNSAYTQIGIGYENAPDDNNSDGDSDTYWTQVFGTESIV